jgi:hypothetical protein
LQLSTVSKSNTSSIGYDASSTIVSGEFDQRGSIRNSDGNDQTLSSSASSASFIHPSIYGRPSPQGSIAVSTTSSSDQYV